MAVVGFQDYWLTGSRFYYKRDADGATNFPLIDLGTISPATPNFDITKVELFDSDGGINSLVDEAVTQITEEFTITCSNLNNENLATLFLADRPVANSQTTGAVTNVQHFGQPGYLVKIVDSNGDGVYGLTSVDAVTVAGGTTVIEYTVVSLERGIIRIDDSSDNLVDLTTAGGNIDVDYTLPSITGLRELNPQDLQGTVVGDGYLVFGRGNNARQTVREGRMSLTPAGGTFGIDEFSNMELTLKFLSDLTLANPAGRLYNWKGALPDKS